MSAGSSEGSQPSIINSWPSRQCSGRSSMGWILPFFKIARIIGTPRFTIACDMRSRFCSGLARERSQPAARIAFGEHRNVHIAPVLLEHLHQVLTVNQCDRLVLGELPAVPPVIAGRHKNT